MAKDFILQRFGYSGNPRGGPILLYDDLEDQLKWVWRGGGAGSKVVKDGDRPFDKNYCVKLETALSVAERYCYIIAWRTFPFGISARVKVECVFLTDDWGPRGAFRLSLYQIKQGWYNYGSFYYSSFAKTVYLECGPYGADIEVEELRGGLALGCYHRVCLGFDFDKLRYTRVKLDHKTADVSQFDIVSESGEAEFGAVVLEFGHGVPRRPPMERLLYVDQVLVLEE